MKKKREKIRTRKRQLPNAVVKSLQAMKVNITDVLYFAKCDLDERGDYMDSYSILTKDNLILVRDSSIEHEHRKRIHFYKGVLETEQGESNEWAVQKIPISEIDTVFIETGVGCNNLVITGVDGKQKIAGVFTNCYQNEMHQLTRVLGQIKRKETVDIIEETELYCPDCGRMYPDEQQKICPHCTEKKSILFRILTYFKPYRVKLIVLMVTIVCTSLINLVWPYLNGTVLYDRILRKDNSILEKYPIFQNDFFVALLILVLTMLATKLCMLILDVLRRLLTVRMVVNVVRDMKQDVFRTMSKQSISFYKNKQTGGLMTRVLSDAERVVDFFLDGAANFIVNVVMIFATLLVMLKMNVFMTIATICMFHIQEGFYICVLAISHNAYKYVCLNDFTGIRINDGCRITCPVYFNLFTGFTIDVHGSTVFLLILLDVIAELGIHERFIAIGAAFLHVFGPKEFFADSVTE